MNKEQIIKMDPVMFLSMINMKLRDNYSSLDAFCDDVNIEKDIVINKLKSIGFEYVESLNAFK